MKHNRETIIEAVCTQIQNYVWQSKEKRIKTDVLASAGRSAADKMLNLDFQILFGEVLRRLHKKGIIALTQKTLKSKSFIAPKTVAIIASKQRQEAIRVSSAKQDLVDRCEQEAWKPGLMTQTYEKIKKGATAKDLEMALAINKFLWGLSGDEVIPHRERSLQIFGDEKVLDNYWRKGLWNGLINLSNLNCFYCYEPLNFQEFSKGKAILVIENSATYWSACQANKIANKFSAIVYGRGKVFSSEAICCQALENLRMNISASKVLYYGDIDPAGLSIITTANKHRHNCNLDTIEPATPLYQATIANPSQCYTKSQKADDKIEDACEWLPASCVESYRKLRLEQRWAQETITKIELCSLFEAF